MDVFFCQSEVSIILIEAFSQVLYIIFYKQQFLSLSAMAKKKVNKKQSEASKKGWVTRRKNEAAAKRKISRKKK